MDLIKSLNLAPIPKSLIQDFLQEKDRYKTDILSKSFIKIDLSQEIKEYLCDLFTVDIICHYVEANHLIDIHKDKTRHVFNYLIDPGGDILPTTIYLDETKKNVIREFTLTGYAWYYLRADIFHTVKNVQQDKVRSFIRVHILNNNDLISFLRKHKISFEQ